MLDDAVPLVLPELRIGIDCGVAVWYEGDLYGPAVNRAARIVAEAPAGAVVASHSFSGTVSERTWSPRGAFDLKGIGTVELVELQRVARRPRV
jgi:class 3 adenylate cyclase